jgi:uncharacterized protein (DUF58 family)
MVSPIKAVLGGSPAVARRLEVLHLTVSGVVLLVFAGLGWLLAHHLGSKAAYLLVYAGVLAMVVSFLASRQRIGLTVERSKLPGRMREGQTNSVVLSVTGRRRVSAVILKEELDPALGSMVELPIASLTPGEPMEHRYALVPQRRGVYSVGPLWGVWTDPFGLTTRRQQLLDPVEIIVHPTTEGVDDRILARMWEDPPVRPPVSKPWPTGFEFYGMRDYVPGDDLRRVVWRAVAKTGRMLVRESEQGITDRVSLFVDNGGDNHSKGEPSDTLELGIRIAASLCKRHIDSGFSVSLTANDGRLATALRGSRATSTLLDHLARLQLSRSPLRSVGELILRDARTGAHFVVITPHLDKEMTRRLRMAIERGASITLAQLVHEDTDPLSLSRATGLGCRVIQIPVGVSIEGSFAHQVGAGLRR